MRWGGGVIIENFRFKIVGLRMKKQLQIPYHDIISLENLFAAWQEFVCGKRNKPDVQEFARHLTDNIVQLHEELANGQYRHGTYQAFAISDPKPRQIHKAAVRDRVLHHAVYRQLYPFFDRTFIADSFSCRLSKGTHRAMSRFRLFAGGVSKNNTRTCWVLKCDIKKFFASINHSTLLDILAQYIPDLGVMLLLQEIIESFSSATFIFPLGQGEKTGLPLGNLTSQLLCNIYMNELDQFVKHRLRAKHYVRYADDFVLLSEDRNVLEEQLLKMSDFLTRRLKLRLHPNKVFIKTFASGVDFLGWVHFPTHRVVRTTTRKRMLKRIQQHPTNQTLQSYLGLLSHGNTYTVRQEAVNLYGLVEKGFET